MNYTTIKTCRVCGSKKLTPIFSLRNLYVSTFVNKLGENIGRAPLELVYCENCTLLQLKHTAPQELMYSKHYWYRSGVNPVISKDLKEIAKKAQKIAKPKKGDIILDIGANDGTLLKYYPKNLILVGCEPATNLLSELKKVTKYVIGDFWTNKKWQKIMGEKKAKIITAIGMFYDMEDPNQFIGDVARVLSEDGIFIAQLMCLRPMIEKNDVGNICHEHLEFYSYRSLVELFERNGLEIFKVEGNNINGGSYRLFARHIKTGSIDYPEKITKKDYRDFFKRIENNKKLCVDFVKKEFQKGKKIFVYGASTKGNTILQYYGLDNKLISGAADKSPEKWGKYTVGTHVPICTEQEAREKADYFLVLPWAFFDSFYKKETQWLKKGGKFIVPIPKFKVVSSKK
ncbi:MAG: methyltransferase domain-containing protein [Candidatus Staskawiczbacteria bacterium]|nr:methyltransferase domain-containing protein [Candidatus Staskawiczbacteria bacterium]